MNPPRLFKVNIRTHGYSICMACWNWRLNKRFHHEGINWILCELDYADYWENTDKLLSDYKEHP